MASCFNLKSGNFRGATKGIPSAQNEGYRGVPSQLDHVGRRFSIQGRQAERKLSLSPQRRSSLPAGQKALDAKGVTEAHIARERLETKSRAADVRFQVISECPAGMPIHIIFLIICTLSLTQSPARMSATEPRNTKAPLSGILVLVGLFGL